MLFEKIVLIIFNYGTLRIFLQVRAQAYDLVLNGSEVGGGSVRIHNPVLQERVLQLLDIKKDTLQHIIDMLGKSVVFMWFIYSSKLIVSIINFN